MKTTPSGRNPVFLVNPGFRVTASGPDWTEGEKRVVGTAGALGPWVGSIAATGGKAGTEGGSGNGGNCGTEGGSMEGNGGTGGRAGNGGTEGGSGKAGSSLIVFSTTGGKASTSPTTGVRTCFVG
ncbi:hypothetical protein AB0O52_20705 [Arthrobacter sp. NPDC080073]|uniref:hypothetical protein n=1 Tax=Arthrobacter sp. NPDC080073 TaxID=3155919 RepID=UPI00342014C6